MNKITLSLAGSLAVLAIACAGGGISRQSYITGPTTPPAPTGGDVDWQVVLQDPTPDGVPDIHALDVVTDGTDAIVLLEQVTPTGRDYVVRRYSPSGAELASIPLGSTTQPESEGSGAISIRGGKIHTATTEGAGDIIVRRYTLPALTLDWSHTLDGGGADGVDPSGLAADDTGVLVAGFRTAAGSGKDAWLVRVDGTPVTAWEIAETDATDSRWYGVSLDATGATTVGEFAGTQQARRVDPTGTIAWTAAGAAGHAMGVGNLGGEWHVIGANGLSSTSWRLTSAGATIDATTPSTNGSGHDVVVEPGGDSYRALGRTGCPRVERVGSQNWTRMVMPPGGDVGVSQATAVAVTASHVFAVGRVYMPGGTYAAWVARILK